MVILGVPPFLGSFWDTKQLPRPSTARDSVSYLNSYRFHWFVHPPSWHPRTWSCHMLRDTTCDTSGDDVTNSSNRSSLIRLNQNFALSTKVVMRTTFCWFDFIFSENKNSSLSLELFFSKKRKMKNSVDSFFLSPVLSTANTSSRSFQLEKFATWRERILRPRSEKNIFIRKIFFFKFFFLKKKKFHAERTFYEKKSSSESEEFLFSKNSRGEKI